MSYRLNEAKMFMDISDGIAVVINTESGMYYGMNMFGTEVFDALTRGMDEASLVGALKAIPGAPADMEARYHRFVNDLLQYELLVPSTPVAGVALSPAAAADDGFVLEVNAFADAQEMLLADPIHEVKEDTGWTPEKDSIGYSKEETREREKKVK